MNNFSFSTPTKVAIVLVLLVYVASIIANNFGSSSSVPYTNWFLDQVKYLDLTAKQLFKQAQQDEDPVWGIIHYTAALTTLDILERIIDPEEIKSVTGTDIIQFIKAIDEYRDTLMQHLYSIITTSGGRVNMGNNTEVDSNIVGE